MTSAKYEPACLPVGSYEFVNDRTVILVQEKKKRQFAATQSLQLKISFSNIRLHIKFQLLLFLHRFTFSFVSSYLFVIRW